MFSSAVYAQDGAGLVPSGGLIDFLPIILIVVVFWFLILRPQNKKMKEHREMVANVARGDTVVTAGGMIGKVTKVKDGGEVEVEVSKDVRVRVVASTLSDVRSKNEPVKTDSK